MNKTEKKHTGIVLKGLSSEDIFNIINADDNLDYIQAITTAVNAHDDLVEALREAISYIGINSGNPIVAKARQALKKAGA